MLHIQRKDWLYAVAEELVRCLLWFHPAVWWLLGRIQLTREQVVDQSAIECTQAPEQYLDALIAIAATRLQSDLAPAPLFLKKRHLRKRVASIVKGVGMSKRSLMISTFAVFSALPLVVGIAVWQFPLMAAPQEVQDGPGVTVKNGYFKILHRTAIPYPPEADGASGGVVVSVSVNPKGEVTDARVVSSQGPDAFRKAALASVLNWHFATDSWQVGRGDSRPLPPEFEIAIEFSGSQARASEPAQPPQSVGKSFVVEGLDLSSLPQLLRDKVTAANLIREGEIMEWSRFRDIEQGLKAIDSHLRLTGAIKNDKTVRMRVSLASENPTLKPQIEANPPHQDGTPPQRIRVGGNVQAANLILKVTPIYPSDAKAAHVQGVVRMNVEIGRDGHVTHIELVSGPPLLVPTAMDAVKQWVYRPTLLNGQPVEVLTVVDVNFTLLE
jgi:TonB family protein